MVLFPVRGLLAHPEKIKRITKTGISFFIKYIIRRLAEKNNDKKQCPPVQQWSIIVKNSC
jgi:hypothetical protein